MLQDLTLTVVTGPPETGRFTTAKLLRTLLGSPGVVCVSTGQILKRQEKKRTPIGLRIADVRAELAPGCYMPDDLVIPAVDAELERLAQEKRLTRVILSGFPQTQAQADHLGGLPVTGVIDIVAAPEQSVPKRGKSAEHLRTSWQYYLEHTLPMLRRLRDRVIHLDRDKPVLKLLEAAIPAITPDSAEQQRILRSLRDRDHPIRAQIAQIKPQPGLSFDI